MIIEVSKEQLQEWRKSDGSLTLEEFVTSSKPKTERETIVEKLETKGIAYKKNQKTVDLKAMLGDE